MFIAFLTSVYHLTLIVVALRILLAIRLFLFKNCKKSLFGLLLVSARLIILMTEVYNIYCLQLNKNTKLPYRYLVHMSYTLEICLIDNFVNYMLLVHCYNPSGRIYKKSFKISVLYDCGAKFKYLFRCLKRNLCSVQRRD